MNEIKIYINKQGYLEGTYKELIQIWPMNYSEETLKKNLIYSYIGYIKYKRDRK